MKVKEEDLRREILRAINGEDLNHKGFLTQGF